MNAYNDAVAITPSDTADLGRVTDAIYVGGAGTVAAVLPNNRVVSVTAAAGTLLPLRVRRINATGTAATLIVALYEV